MATRRTVLAILLALLVSCKRDECPELGPDLVEMSAADPEGFALEAVLSGVSQFRRWTGRENICIYRIEVVDDIQSSLEAAGGDDTEFDGLFADGQVTVSTQSEDPTLTTRHELCHAIDFGEDIVRGEGDLSTGAGTPHEDFARACDDGPHRFDLFDETRRACHGTNSLAKLLIDEVFLGHWRGYAYADLTAGLGGTLPLPDGVRVSQVSAAGGGLLLAGETSGGSETLLVVTPEGEVNGLPTPPSVALLVAHSTSGLYVGDLERLQVLELRGEQWVEVAPVPDDTSWIGVLDGEVWTYSARSLQHGDITFPAAEFTPSTVDPSGRWIGGVRLESNGDWVAAGFDVDTDTWRTAPPLPPHLPVTNAIADDFGMTGVVLTALGPTPTTAARVPWDAATWTFDASPCTPEPSEAGLVFPVNNAPTLVEVRETEIVLQPL